MVLAETVKANKPEPEIFKAIIDMNPEIEPHNILFVDDKEENILASEAEGLTGKMYRPGLVSL
jgi:HAD superfamily hydrolase (TIGR01509 family)